METFHLWPILCSTAVATLLAGCGGSNSSPSTSTSVPNQSAQAAAEEFCGTLAGTTIPSSEIGLPTKGVTIVAAALIKATDTNNTNGEYCKVNGSIHPVDIAADDIRFEVDIPTNWNGKTLHFGGGGFDGTIPMTTGHANSGFAMGAEAPGVPTPLARGYVTFGSDAGRQGYRSGTVFNSPAVTLQNDETLANYAGNHIKKTRDVAAFLTKKRYGKSATQNYYIGGSGGGRQALIAAQKYPADYNGIVSTYPASNLTGVFLQMARISQAAFAPGGFISPAKGKVLVQAVLNQCDGLDGVKDGVISNPNACQFNPVVLRCENGQDTGDTCFSDLQLKTLSTTTTPLNTNYDFANGIRSTPGFGYFALTSFFDGVFLPYGATAASAQDEYLTSTSSFFYSLGTNATQYAIARDKNMTALKFNPVDPGPLTARTQAVSALWDATTTDLTEFQKRGGKVILQHGVADQAIPAQMSIDYYNRLVGRFGQESLGQFLKFYLVPGSAHGTNSQFAAEYDALGVLDNWVTKGTAPNSLVITDVSIPTAGRTRPLCEYPKWPRYNGSGDVNSATSFTCVN